MKESTKKKIKEYGPYILGSVALVGLSAVLYKSHLDRRAFIEEHNRKGQEIIDVLSKYARDTSVDIWDGTVVGDTTNLVVASLTTDAEYFNPYSSIGQQIRFVSDEGETFVAEIIQAD